MGSVRCTGENFGTERRERDIDKLDKKNKWYEKGGHETVMFVEATPNEELA